jgi:rod shape-determining protein MreD
VIPEKRHGTWVIVVSFCFAFVLTILPLPDLVRAWRPEWVAMVLIYWCVAVPQRVGVFIGWSVGLIHDIATNTLLGQHALSFCIIAYIGVALHQQMRIFPIVQQTVSVGILIIISQLHEIWIRGILGLPQLSWEFFYPSIASMVLWHWVFVVLRDMRRTYSVS